MKTLTLHCYTIIYVFKLETHLVQFPNCPIVQIIDVHSADEAGSSNRGTHGPVRGSGYNLLMWQFLIEVLMSQFFEKYIRWTGVGLQFVVHNPVVTFTEWRMRKSESAEPTAGDPATRWQGQLISNEQAKNAEKAIYRSYQRRNVGNENISKPFIEKAKGVTHGYYFDGHEHVCEYLGWPLEELQEYIRQVAARKRDYAPSVKSQLVVPSFLNPASRGLSKSSSLVEPSPCSPSHSSQAVGTVKDYKITPIHSPSVLLNSGFNGIEHCPFLTAPFIDALTSFTSSSTSNHETVNPQIIQVDSSSNYRNASSMIQSIKSTCPCHRIASTLSVSAPTTLMDATKHEQEEIAKIAADLKRSSELYMTHPLENDAEMTDSTEVEMQDCSKELSLEAILELSIQMREDWARKSAGSEDP